MPTYVYEREDGNRFELEQKISEDALTTCPETGQKVRRVIHAGSFQLKGSGWYKTDYAASGAPTKEGDATKSDKAESGSSGHSCSSGGCGCGPKPAQAKEPAKTKTGDS